MPGICLGKIPIAGDLGLSYTLYSPQSNQLSGRSPPILVVFINGLRTVAADWDVVATELQSKTPLYLLTYDRWNCGESDPLPSTRSHNDISTCAKDLSLLLPGIASRHKLDVQTRLLLVGSSIGCCIIRMFATDFYSPSLGSIHGIIFLDSYISNTDFVSLFPKRRSGEPPGLTKTREVIVRMFHPSVPNPERLDRSNAATLLPLANKPEFPGSPPFLVVAHDPEYNVEEMVEKLGIDKDSYLKFVQSAWDEYNHGLQELSKDSLLVIAENSAHFIYKDRPDLVIEWIKKMAERARITSISIMC